MIILCDTHALAFRRARQIRQSQRKRIRRARQIRQSQRKRIEGEGAAATTQGGSHGSGVSVWSYSTIPNIRRRDPDTDKNTAAVVAAVAAVTAAAAVAAAVIAASVAAAAAAAAAAV